MSLTVKSCSLDPVPTFIVREFVDTLLPFITSMVNASLTRPSILASQKHATVSSLLKKPGLDTADMSDFKTWLSCQRSSSEWWPSSLTSSWRLKTHCHTTTQSAYRKLKLSLNTDPTCHQRVWSSTVWRYINSIIIIIIIIKRHSTETVMLRVHASGSWQTASDADLIGLLDLSSAFHSVDHECCYSDYITSSVCRTQCYSVWRRLCRAELSHWLTTGQLSPVKPVPYGVLQGSVHGPLLFVLYTPELHRVVDGHGPKQHQYADDCQICLSTPACDVSCAVFRFTDCIADVDDWMSASRSRLYKPCKNPSPVTGCWAQSFSLIVLTSGKCPWCRQ